MVKGKGILVFKNTKMELELIDGQVFEKTNNLNPINIDTLKAELQGLDAQEQNYLNSLQERRVILQEKIIAVETFLENN